MCSRIRGLPTDYASLPVNRPVSRLASAQPSQLLPRLHTNPLWDRRHIPGSYFEGTRLRAPAALQPWSIDFPTRRLRKAPRRPCRRPKHSRSMWDRQPRRLLHHTLGHRDLCLCQSPPSSRPRLDERLPPSGRGPVTQASDTRTARGTGHRLARRTPNGYVAPGGRGANSPVGWPSDKVSSTFRPIHERFGPKLPLSQPAATHSEVDAQATEVHFNETCMPGPAASKLEVREGFQFPPENVSLRPVGTRSLSLFRKKSPTAVQEWLLGHATVSSSAWASSLGRGAGVAFHVPFESLSMMPPPPLLP